MFYLISVLFVVAMGGALWLTLFGLPGNWLIVVTALAYSYFLPPEYGPTFGWGTIALLVALAGLGEVLEFIAGAAGLARGGSKRGAVFAVLGAMFGGVLGTILIPIPFIGTLLLASLGAMGGAILGELAKGRETGIAIEIGKAAFWGRLFGTLAKTLVGAVMVVVAMLAAFLR